MKQPDVATAQPRTRLLVVDDDPLLRKVLARVLGLAHDVATAASAGEALALIAAGRRFDALLCDLHLADSSGRDLHATLARMAPEQAARVVFLTGDENATRDLPAPWLLKPVDLAALEHTVARVRSGRDVSEGGGGPRGRA